MNEIKIFNSPNFGEVRTAMQNGEILFAATDVAKCLGYANPNDAVIKHCKSNGVAFCEVIDSMNRKQNAKFITKGNVIRLVANSTLPQAEAIESWIFDEVIPSVLKTGGYIVSKSEDTPEEIMARALLVAQETLKRKEQRLIEAERKVEESAPAVAFTNAVQSSSSSCLIGELAKLIAQNGYPIGEKRLFQWLREHGYLGKRGECYNIPNQQYVEQGLFIIKKGVRSGSGGVLHTTATPKVTGKGQIYFVNKFLNN